MFGIGIGELIVIAIVALVLVGPKKLPDMMKQAGKFFVQMRRTANDVKSTFDDFVREAENELRQEELEQLKIALGKQNQEIKSLEAVSGDSSSGTPSAIGSRPEETDHHHGHPGATRPHDHHDPYHHDDHDHRGEHVPHHDRQETPNDLRPEGAVALDSEHLATTSSPAAPKPVVQGNEGSVTHQDDKQSASAKTQEPV